MDRKLQLCEGFLETQKELLSELDEIFPRDVEITKAHLLITSVPIIELINRFRTTVMPHKKNITTPNETFFLDHPEIFSYFSPGHFKKLWLSGKLDKPVIWKFFQTSVIIVDAYDGC